MDGYQSNMESHMSQHVGAEEEIRALKDSSSQDGSSKNGGKLTTASATVDAYHAADISTDLVQIAAEEEIRLKDSIPPTSSKKNRRTGGMRKLHDPDELSIQPKKRKQRPIVISCTHDVGDHFDRRYLEESLSLNKVSIVMNPPRGSIIWSFCGFPEVDDKICAAWIICTVCKNIFAFGDSAPSSGAKRHIEKKHRELLADVLKSMADDDGESGHVIVADCGASAIPMRIVSEEDAEKTPGVSRRRGRKKMEKYEATVFDEHGQPVQVVYDDFADDPLETSGVGSAHKFRRLGGVGAAKQPSHMTFTSTVCTSCNIDFKNVALAMMHRSCHGLGGKFQCAQCGVSLSNMFDFWAHLYSRICG